MALPNALEGPFGWTCSLFFWVVTYDVLGSRDSLLVLMNPVGTYQRSITGFLLCYLFMSLGFRTYLVCHVSGSSSLLWLCGLPFVLCFPSAFFPFPQYCLVWRAG